MNAALLVEKALTVKHVKGEVISMACFFLAIHTLAAYCLPWFPLVGLGERWLNARYIGCSFEMHENKATVTPFDKDFQLVACVN